MLVSDDAMHPKGVLIVVLAMFVFNVLHVMRTFSKSRGVGVKERNPTYIYVDVDFRSDRESVRTSRLIAMVVRRVGRTICRSHYLPTNVQGK